tara:strand:- start:26943 stop:27167 length:225 start_codon:yes stop_codon:yes gene_type:complete
MEIKEELMEMRQFKFSMPLPELVDEHIALFAEVKRLRVLFLRMRHWAEPKMHEVHHDAWRKLHEEIYELEEGEN